MLVNHRLDTFWNAHYSQVAEITFFIFLHLFHNDLSMNFHSALLNYKDYLVDAKVI